MNESVDRVLRYIAGTKGAIIHQLGQHFHFRLGRMDCLFSQGRFAWKGSRLVWKAIINVIMLLLH